MSPFQPRVDLPFEFRPVFPRPSLVRERRWSQPVPAREPAILARASLPAQPVYVVRPPMVRCASLGALPPRRAWSYTAPQGPAAQPTTPRLVPVEAPKVEPPKPQAPEPSGLWTPSPRSLSTRRSPVGNPGSFVLRRAEAVPLPKPGAEVSRVDDDVKLSPVALSPTSSAFASFSPGALRPK